MQITVKIRHLAGSNPKRFEGVAIGPNGQWRVIAGPDVSQRVRDEVKGKIEDIEWERPQASAEGIFERGHADVNDDFFTHR